MRPAPARPASAWRTVIRVTPNVSARSVSLGNSDPGGRPSTLILSAIAAAIVRYLDGLRPAAGDLAPPAAFPAASATASPAEPPAVGAASAAAGAGSLDRSAGPPGDSGESRVGPLEPRRPGCGLDWVVTDQSPD